MFMEMRPINDATLEELVIDKGYHTLEEAQKDADEKGIDLMEMINPYNDLKGVDAYLKAVFDKPSDIFLIREAYMNNFVKMCNEKEGELDTNQFIPVNNIPDYARGLKYLVARWCEGEWWFWGAWNDRNKAEEIAQRINGKVFDNE